MNKRRRFKAKQRRRLLASRGQGWTVFRYYRQRTTICSVTPYFGEAAMSEQTKRGAAWER